jgi:hypothetical protein
MAMASLPQMKPTLLFQGVMIPTMPTGSITTSASLIQRLKS